VCYLQDWGMCRFSVQIKKKINNLVKKKKTIKLSALLRSAFEWWVIPLRRGKHAMKGLPRGGRVKIVTDDCE
jgi:hypothetical protein